MGGSDGDDHEALLGTVAAGDLRALERLYRELRVPVFAVALAVLRDRSLAEDVLHDTFVRVAVRAASYRPGTRRRAWLLAIARNLALDALRRRGREPAAAEPEWNAADDPAETVDWTRMLLTLEPVEREIVALHALGGLTHAEIAAHLELPPGTVRWKYRIALDRLAPLVSESTDA